VGLRIGLTSLTSRSCRAGLHSRDRRYALAFRQSSDALALPSAAWTSIAQLPPRTSWPAS